LSFDDEQTGASIKSLLERELLEVVPYIVIACRDALWELYPDKEAVELFSKTLPKHIELQKENYYLSHKLEN
jgi:hypothetical protein